MDSQKFINIILQDTFTREDAVRRLRVLRIILEQKFFTQSKDSSLLQSRDISPDDYKIVQSWLSLSPDLFNHINIYKVLNNISNSLDKLPDIIFYVASEINDPLYLAKITQWVREFIAPCALLDLKVDPRKVGGLAFVQEGRLQDYSLALFMKRKRQDILDLIRDYSISPPM